MNINERIKDFRKNIVHMSQTEFALKLGMKQTSVSTFEKSGATVTDPTIKALCLAFNLNEDWVRHGAEPMYIQAPSFSLDDFVKSKGATEQELEIVKTYFEIDPEIRRNLMKHFATHLMSQKDKHPDTPEELESKFPPVEDAEESAG